MANERAPLRRDFVVGEVLGTRWADNDVYGHLNNAAYYTYIDTAVNRFMIANAGIDIHSGPLIALVAETGCRYFSALAFPDDIEVALAVDRLGNSHVRWSVGVFGAPTTPDSIAAVSGHFVHVLVDRATRRPTPWPDAMREALAGAFRDNRDG